LTIEKLIRKYNENIEKYLYEEIGLLKHNQKPKINIKGGIIYIFSALNTNHTLYKLGKAFDKNNRFNTYNSGNANDIILLFIVKVNDIDTVETCVKMLIKKYQYRKRKEIYEIDLDVLKDLVINCDEFVDGMKKLIKKFYIGIASLN